MHFGFLRVHSFINIMIAEVVATPQLCNIFPAPLRFLQFQTSWDIRVQDRIREMLGMRPDEFANLEKLTLTIGEPVSNHWYKRAAELFGKTIQLCKDADVDLEVATVERKYEPTFFGVLGFRSHLARQALGTLLTPE